MNGMSNSAAADIVRAEDLAERTLATSPRSCIARSANGQVLRAQHRYGEAIVEYETAIALNRNPTNAYSHCGWCAGRTSVEYVARRDERPPLNRYCIGEQNPSC
jgi:hypothetical protein